MIYIYNNIDNKITTDSVSEVIPVNLLVYIDDVLLLSAVNESTHNEYIVFNISKDILINADIVNSEHQLKLVNADTGTVIKRELVIFHNLQEDTKINVETTKKIIIYGE